MAKKTTNQLSELAESLKAKNEIPVQTVIEATELESLKEKAEPSVKAQKGRRKGVFSFTLPNELVEELDRERQNATFNPSRSEYLEYIIRQYFNNQK